MISSKPIYLYFSLIESFKREYSANQLVFKNDNFDFFKDKDGETTLLFLHTDNFEKIANELLYYLNDISITATLHIYSSHLDQKPKGYTYLVEKLTPHFKKITHSYINNEF